MKPDFFQIKNGCYKIGINPFMCGLTKKPVVRIECVEDGSVTIDGEYQEEIECAMFTFRNIEDFDLFIQKLQDARAFLLHER
jgi:hypothetical protein